MASKTQPFTPESAKARALRAWPIVACLVLMIRAFIMSLIVEPYTERFYAQKRFESGGVSVEILHEFYGIPILDRVFSHLVIFFSQMQTRVPDPWLYTQSMIFLTECAGMYAMMMLETSRRGKQAIMFQPIVACFLSQICTGGGGMSTYFFFLYVHRPLDKLARSDFRPLDGNRVLAILPAIIIGAYPSTYLSYFHPTFEGRHWWCWFWQLYAIWSGITYAILHRVFRLSSTIQKQVATPERALSIAKFTLAATGVVNTVIYWYATWGLGVSIKDAFFPTYLIQAPTDYTVAFRTVIQYDYICVQGALLLWLALSFRDLRAAGLSHTSWVQHIVVAVAIASVFGVGNVVSFGWIKREEILTKLGDNKKTDKQEKSN